MDTHSNTDRNTHGTVNGKTRRTVNGNTYGKASKWRIRAKLLAAATAMMLIFTGCAGTPAASSADGASQTTSVASTAAYTADSKSDQFTDRDLSGDYDEASALKISLDGTQATVTEEGTDTNSADVSIDGSTITIKSEGTYIFSGTLTDGMIIVEADDSAKVQIVLDGADITSSTSAALYIKSADKVFVTTAEGTENTLANGGSFTAIDDSNIDGAVFAKDDITFNGSGTLTVTSPAGHGIVGKDDVKIAGGTVSITAAKHGIQANDSARFAEAVVNITAGTDGVHVSDSSDAEEGTASDSYFYNADADLTIKAGDDGIHADEKVQVEAGSITVTKSYEGIEGLTIDISGGEIDVTATDDGLNAAGGNTATAQSSSSAGGNTASAQGSSAADSQDSQNTFGDDDWAGGKGGFPGGGFSDGGIDGSIVISDGSLHITAGGDGVDSNGSVEISGGITIVEGPSSGDTSVLDYNGTASITGGTFIGTGGAGMAENFSRAENQGLIAVSVGNQTAGSTVTLKDSDGKVIAEQTPQLDYAVVFISTSDLQQGGTYTLTAGTYSETIELTDAIYSNFSGSKGGFGGGGPRQGGMMDENSGINNGNGGMQGGPQNGEQMGQGGPQNGDRMGGPQNGDQMGQGGPQSGGKKGGPQKKGSGMSNNTDSVSGATQQPQTV